MRHVEYEKIMLVFLHLKHNLVGVKKCNNPYKEIDESNSLLFSFIVLLYTTAS